jgi:hypothetical protein
MMLLCQRHKFDRLSGGNQYFKLQFLQKQNSRFGHGEALPFSQARLL